MKRSPTTRKPTAADSAPADPATIVAFRLYPKQHKKLGAIAKKRALSKSSALRLVIDESRA
jgi:hypothetical protein